MIELTSFPLIEIFGVSLVALFLAGEIGHRFGLRVAGEANVSTLEAAMLGLLALMIGFTFSMALTRFELRRENVLNDANAIGSAALRASLLPAPHAAASLKLLSEYVQIRLDITQRVPSPDELDAAVARSNGIQKALWREVKAVTAKDNAMVPAGLYIQSLNEMFDSQQKRLSVHRNRVPDAVLLTLYAIAIVAIGFTGYASGTAERRWRLPVYIMSFMVAAVILLIQDMDRFGAGFISVSQQPMIDTADNLAAYMADIEKAAPGP